MHIDKKVKSDKIGIALQILQEPKREFKSVKSFTQPYKYDHLTFMLSPSKGERYLL